jgi:hypothetical protein
MKTPRLTSGYGMRFSRTPQKLTHYHTREKRKTYLSFGCWLRNRLLGAPMR